MMRIRKLTPLILVFSVCSFVFLFVSRRYLNTFNPWKYRANHEAKLNLEQNKFLQSLPDWYYNKTMARPTWFTKQCAKFPPLDKLKFNNFYWQEASTKQGTFYILNAYLDTRIEKHYIRFIGMVDKIPPLDKMYCHIWYKNSRRPIIVKVSHSHHIWYAAYGGQEKGVLQPYLLSCPIQTVPQGKIPMSASLVQSKCETATNNLKVIYEPKPKYNGYGVCVKGLDYQNDDFAVRAIEWIETLNILEVGKIYMYVLYTTNLMTTILEYYEKRGLVEIVYLTLPGSQPNLPYIQHEFLKSQLTKKRINEMIPYNDCLYKNMYKHQFMTLLDMDEIIMPVQDFTWNEMIDTIWEQQKGTKKRIDSIRFLNAYFLDVFMNSSDFQDDIPKEYHMLQHIYRMSNHTQSNMYFKSLFNASRVLTLHNHRPFQCLPDSDCSEHIAKSKIGHLQHYRRDCSFDFTDCEKYKQNITKDENILRYKNHLKYRLKKVISDLGIEL